MRIILLIAMVYFVFQTRAKAQEDSMKNLESLDVLIESFPSDLQSTSLSKRQIENDIQLKLRQNRIEINKESSPYLYLNINALAINYKNGNTESYVYHVSLALNQIVFLGRDVSISDYGATTWSRSFLGYASPLIIEDEIQDSVDKLMNQFLNYYLEVNPK